MTTPNVRLTPERLAEIRGLVAPDAGHEAGPLWHVRLLLPELDAVTRERDEWKAKARAIAQDRAEIWNQVGAMERGLCDFEQQIQALTGERDELLSRFAAQAATIASGDDAPVVPFSERRSADAPGVGAMGEER